MAEQNIEFGTEGIEFKSTGWIVSERQIMAPPADIPPVMDCATPSMACPVPVMDCAVPVMASFVFQPWGEPYDAETGLSRGTIFPALDLPWVGGGACRYE